MTFIGESDCEISACHLYQKMGVDMFKELDGEFALILFDGDTKEFIAARDPIGIRPLFYGYDQNQHIVFASEAKNLVGICDEIYTFSTRTLLSKWGVYLLSRYES